MATTPNRPDVDEFGFRVYHEKFIFIASSSDVRPERILAEQTLRDTLRDLGEDIHVYSWELDVDDFDQRFTMQKSIPRPGHENCVGVVYIVGERLGLPLEDGDYRQHLGASATWIEPGAGGLRETWSESPEAERALLDDGSFALTGGVFEFLAARGQRDELYPHGKPVLLTLLAASEIPRDGGEIELNGGRLLAQWTGGLSFS